MYTCLCVCLGSGHRTKVYQSNWICITCLCLSEEIGGKNKNSICLLKLPRHRFTYLPCGVQLWDDSSERQPGCVTPQLTSLSLTPSSGKINLLSLPDWPMSHCVRFYDCSSYRGSRKQGRWLCVCMSCVYLGSMLSRVENVLWARLDTTASSGSLSTYYTLTRFISFLSPRLLSVRCYILPDQKVCCVSVYVQGVMQDVEILVMPQGYISQCPDLNRSECSLLVKTLQRLFAECLI